MGNSTAKEQKKIKKLNVSMFNYCGHVKSPFQFYSRVSKNQYLYKQHRKIDEQMILQVRQRFGEKYMDLIQKHVRKIDKSVKERYTPLYVKDCGVQYGQFITENRFQQIWIQYWDKIDHQQTKKYKNQSIQYLLKFDLAAYKAILKTVYNQISTFEDIIQNKSVIRYLDIMEMYFTQNHMNKQKKAQMLLNYLRTNDIDVMFVQNTEDQLYEYLQKHTNRYRIIRGRAGQKIRLKDVTLAQVTIYKKSQTAILIKQTKFQKASDPKKSNLIFNNIKKDPLLSKQEIIDFMNWGHIAIISLDYFIFISVQLSSKTNKQVYQKIRKQIYILRDRFRKKYIVIGGFKLYQQQLEIKKLPYLKCCTYNTTNYIRSHIQTQWKQDKIRQNDNSSYLYYDHRLALDDIMNYNQLSGVFTVAGTKKQQHIIIPNKDHPFHHYIMKTVLKYPSKINNMAPKYDNNDFSSDQEVDPVFQPQQNPFLDQNPRNQSFSNQILLITLK